MKPRHPLIFEINTWTWLYQLSLKYRKKINLSNIPAVEYDDLAHRGYDAVWLMGVWERSPFGKAIARQHAGIMEDVFSALPDFNEDDFSGSPFCVRNYKADKYFGGPEGLATARKELAQRGIKLILDFVPNHVAPDHPWTKSHPDYFIRGSEKEYAENPDAFIPVGKEYFVRARDPFYPPWPDVIQLNIFNSGLRRAMTRLIKDIASQCDGIRCDMAMLLMNDIFAETWKEKAGAKPAKEFWEQAVKATRKSYPEFLFIAEVYWEKEWDLMQMGFDYCYDKRLYDRLMESNTDGVRQHLSADPDFQKKLLRFIENHDEARIAGTFPLNRQIALAIASLTLPGARLIHQGQTEGRKIKVPVFIDRLPLENLSGVITDFYNKLLAMLMTDAIRNGKWGLCEASGWPENQTFLNLLAWEWHGKNETLLIIINLSDQPAQGLVKAGFPFRRGKTYQLFDVISGVLYERDGDEMVGTGLFAGLPAWGTHTFLIEH